ncbi:MAG: SDR family NAD(P)-dependent oxidoreductase [Acutalibacteraceae bacterium]
MNKCWFDYKTVIVSGASSGIGKGLVKKLINDHGCKVIGIARNEEKIKALIDELGYKADYFSYYLFDVSKRENWINFTKQITDAGIKPDILINNAGMLPKFNKFGHYSIEYIEKAMQVNFYSYIYSMNCLMPIILKSQTPGIVNVASSAALCSLAGTSVYSASKAAVKSCTEAVREEYRGRCYVGLVCPGFTKTDIFRDQSETKDSRSQKALDMVSTACEKMVDNIVNGMWKKKEKMVFGIDAHLMSSGDKLFGVFTSRVSSKVMELSGLELFADVFTE